jgi:hypothetical protein
VYYLGRYDVWKHEDIENCFPFQYGMKNQDTRPENQEFWSQFFITPNMTDNIMSIVDEGIFIQQYEAKQSAIYCKATAFEIEFEGLKCICVNKALTNSIVFASVYDPKKHDAMISFYRNKREWKVSLYSTHSHVDVSEVCKRWGGGGHAGASGFQCKDIRDVIGEPPKLT